MCSFFNDFCVCVILDNMLKTSAANLSQTSSYCGKINLNEEEFSFNSSESIVEFEEVKDHDSIYEGEKGIKTDNNNNSNTNNENMITKTDANYTRCDQSYIATEFDIKSTTSTIHSFNSLREFQDDEMAQVNSTAIS
jgi:hypothetical protein